MQPRRPNLSLEPTALYAAKAIYTHALSALWRARGGHVLTGGLRILAYHRVSPDRDELAVSPEEFRRQMEHLAASGYSAVGAAEAAATLDRPGHERVVGLTFDDGYRDVAEYALPLLNELGFRATMFLPTGAIDGTHPFNWYRRQPPLLDWPTILELDRTGILDFGAHTISHTNLLTLPESEAAREIAGSKQVLEDRLSHSVQAFSYPAGLQSERERRLVALSGFTVAVGAEAGPNWPHSDRLAMRRLGVGPRDRLLDFRAKIGGGHDRPLPLRNHYRSMRFGSPRSDRSRV